MWFLLQQPDLLNVRRLWWMCLVHISCCIACISFSFHCSCSTSRNQGPGSLWRCCLLVSTMRFSYAGKMTSLYWTSPQRICARGDTHSLWVKPDRGRIASFGNSFHGANNLLCNLMIVLVTWCKTAVTSLLSHWSYCSLGLSHWYVGRDYLWPGYLWVRWWINRLSQKGRNSIPEALQLRQLCLPFDLAFDTFRCGMNYAVRNW